LGIIKWKSEGFIETVFGNGAFFTMFSGAPFKLMDKPFLTRMSFDIIICYK
jgi:hypothetical protein